MRPTEGEAHLLAALGERGVSAIAIDLQDAGKIAKMGIGPLCLAIRGIDVGDHRRMAAAPRPIIAGIGPYLARLGPPTPRIEHRRGGLVGEQPFASSEPFEDMIAQGAKIPGRPPAPIGEGRSVELDALASVDLGLPVQGVSGRVILRTCGL